MGEKLRSEQEKIMWTTFTYASDTLFWLYTTTSKHTAEGRTYKFIEITYFFVSQSSTHALFVLNDFHCNELYSRELAHTENEKYR